MHWNRSNEIYEPTWQVEGVVARAQRPGYPVDRPSLNRIQAWADAVVGMGIKSVVCIVENNQLAHYYHLKLDGDGGLLGYYRSLGLDVVHVPALDHKSPPLNNDELDAVWEAFQRLEKPVLIHCNAGRDRTGAALEYILWHLGEDHAEPGYEA